MWIPASTITAATAHSPRNCQRRQREGHECRTDEQNGGGGQLAHDSDGTARGIPSATEFLDSAGGGPGTAPGAARAGRRRRTAAAGRAEDLGAARVPAPRIAA